MSQTPARTTPRPHETEGIHRPALYHDAAVDPSELEYTFKHALTHDVAYRSLLHEPRRPPHARVVEALGRTYMVRGECGEAIRDCKAALALIPESLRHERFGHSNIETAYAHYMLARPLGALGQFSETLGHLRETLQIAEEAGHDYSGVFPLRTHGLRAVVRA